MSSHSQTLQATTTITAVSLVAERSCSLVNKLACELELLKSKCTNAEQRRYEATQALADVNAKDGVHYQAKNDEDREQLIPQVLQLVEAEEAKKAARTSKVVDLGTSPLEGENLEDPTHPTVDTPSMVDSLVPKVSTDIQPVDTQPPTDLAMP
uniref:Uncharacterized protein n=1 Tax=Cannabis sativa TaxID=3483 RepID=A0A803NMM9_CANSA